MNYKILDEKGVMYTEKQSTKLIRLSQGNLIRESDIDGEKFTKGGIATMLKKGRIAVVGDDGKVEEVVEADPFDEEEEVVVPKNKKDKIKKKK